MNEMKSDPMQYAIDEARRTMREGIGGPFGATIVNSKTGEILSVASNTVLRDNDPTAHAEINAIRKACKKLNSRDLSEYILYTTGHPCPMCLSAIIWANISTVYYGCEPHDADSIGFRDEFIYDFIKGNNADDSILKLIPLNKSRCISLFNEYADSNSEIY